MTPFTLDQSPARVVFGFGTRNGIGREIERLGRRRALVLSTPEQAELGQTLAADLGALAAGTYAGAAMHTPVEITAHALDLVRHLDVDCLVAAGGGSTTGLGKALALHTDLPLIVLPTTYAGSEATSILGQTEDGQKTTLRSPKVLPEVIVYDVDLTMTLPARLTAVSGLNAIAHAVEALYAQDGSPLVSLMAEEAVRVLGSSLPKLYRDPSDREARSDALYGAWLAGACLNAVTMGLHHKLCHTLGGSFDLPHAETHAAVLPQAARYNAAAAPEAMRRTARALGVVDAPRGLFDLAETLGVRTDLASLGLRESDLTRATELATRTPYPNPAALTREGIRALLEDALAGRRP